VGINESLYWSQITGVIKYNIQIEATTNQLQTWDFTTVNTFFPAKSEYAAQYRWRVNVETAQGTSEWTDWRPYTVVEIGKPSRIYLPLIQH